MFQRDLIVAPNGIKDNLANLKNCNPNGIPIIVMHSRQPEITFPTAIGIPQKISQIMLAISETVPPPYAISLPKGQNPIEANLKHCRPNGIPMIVQQHKIPEMIHPKPQKKPPKTNQITLPKHPISNVLS